MEDVAEQAKNQMKTPILIMSSDWHLRTVSPASRAEKCWYTVMERRMNQFRELRERLGNPEILVSGDLFDRHDPPSSLVAWAIEHLRGLGIICIPGQHDCLGHRLDERMTGAYGALVRAGVVTDLRAEEWNLRHAEEGQLYTHVSVYAMPWGKYTPPVKLKHLAPKVISLHKYVWATDNSRYPGADESARVTGITELGNLADVVSIGDNHCTWRVSNFLNHGSLFSTTSAQKEHAHHLGILYSDGSYDWMRFPEESVEWVDVSVNSVVPGADKFIEELKSLEIDAVCFREQLDGLSENLDENGKNSYKLLTEHLDNG